MHIRLVFPDLVTYISSEESFLFCLCFSNFGSHLAIATSIRVFNCCSVITWILIGFDCYVSESNWVELKKGI